MNIINKIIDELRYRIPSEILNIAFKDNNNNWRQHQPISLNEQILTKVIRPRVIVDSNIIGGQEVLINLDGLYPEYQDVQNIVYIIPMEKTQYRQIMSALSISFLPYASALGSSGTGMATFGNMNTNELTNVGMRINNAMSSVPVISTSTVELIGDNTIVIRNPNRMTGFYQLRCILANEANLNNINHRSIHPFAKACEFAVKSYIYNKMIIPMDTTYLLGGQDLGAVKTYIESLSDSEENYQTYLKEVLQAVLFMNDQESYTRFIRCQISPGI